MGSPAFFQVLRREPPAGPQMTPAEYAGNYEQHETISLIEERLPQSLIHCRPSRYWITFFLSPWDTWSAQDFIMGHETIPFNPNTPRGRLSTMDDRRNIEIPPRVSYGSLVGDMDGVSPNGLD